MPFGPTNKGLVIFLEKKNVILQMQPIDPTNKGLLVPNIFPLK